ncbi:hypothetical protein TIFTF001_016576 [Ficus carica]|uniref:Uncharacterized protein n=1 Tax=Ficus carica TaxID=3494 RepID=A0AA88D8W2_FICCA|nr:hypothetical protein TIFTF001_016576 [Ficus carica]
MVRFLAYASPWQEDGRCGKEQGKNEIIGGSVWSTCAEEVLQQLSFGNLLSPDDVVHFIELPLCGVSNGFSATESLPSIEKENPLIVGVLLKKALHVLIFSVPKYIPVIGPQAYVFSFELHQILLMDLFLLKGFV